MIWRGILCLKLIEVNIGSLYSSGGGGSWLSVVAMLVLFVMFAIFAYVFPDNQKLDSDTLAMRNYLLLSVFIQMFAPVHNLAMRVNYYYLLFIPVLIPRILVIRKKRYYQLGVVAAVIMGMFFLSYYIFNMHNGADVLRIYPYVAFWEGLN